MVQFQTLMNSRKIERFDTLAKIATNLYLQKGSNRMSKNKKEQEKKIQEEQKTQEEQKAQAVFNETFGQLLEENELKEDVVIHQPEEDLQDVLFGKSEHEPVTDEELEEAQQNYIPQSVTDEQWEQFASRSPMPPINREQEARAVSIGLQEIRKMKEYMLYINRHMTNEFRRIYATYPLLFTKDFDDVYGRAHKELVTLMEDMENLIAGDIDHVEAVKKEFRLYQTFEEKRLSILYDLLEHYNKKK